PLFSALGTLALAGAALTPWPGFADGPLIAFAAGAALLLRYAHPPVAGGTPALPGALLALAAMTKNEGIAFVVTIGIALAIYDRRQLRHLAAPALVIAIWTAVRVEYALHTDLFAAGVFERVAHNAPHFFLAFAT